MKNIFIALAAFSAILVACESKAPDSTEIVKDNNEEKFDNTRMENDAEFAAKAAEGNMLEVQLGELAQSNATSAKVKEFGKMLIKDHGASNEELTALAMKKNISLPAKLGDEKMKEYNDLNAKKGNEFDRAFADFMVKDHEKDIQAFKDEAEQGKDIEMKSWASEKIPTLEHHLQMAKETQEWVKK